MLLSLPVSVSLWFLGLSSNLVLSVNPGAPGTTRNTSPQVQVHPGRQLHHSKGFFPRLGFFPSPLTVHRELSVAAEERRPYLHNKQTTSSEQVRPAINRLRRLKNERQFFAMSTDRIQQLETTVQNLTADVQSLQQDNAALQLALQQKEVNPAPIVIKFDGDPERFQEFLDACQMQFTFRPLQFTDARTKVVFLVTRLYGNALTWAAELIRVKSPLLDNYDLFLKSFTAAFQRINQVAAAEQELCELQQGHWGMLHYITKFRALAHQAGWPEAVQATLFRKGLREEYKDELARMPPPMNLSALFEEVLQLEYRLIQRQKEKEKKKAKTVFYPRPRSPPKQRAEETNPQPDEPMQLGSIHPPLTEKEKDYRRLRMLCMYCGSEDHLVRLCPLAPPRRNPGNVMARR